ncbi:MAG: transglycosylase SLT domain-containing protein, partial [Thiotrichaceae bacterium]|nr:transglycosylase SLT domain-containing protein [Thiotrichaceae bacterium]
MQLRIKTPLMGVLLVFGLIQTTITNAQSKRDDFLEAYDVLHKGGFYDSSHLRGYILQPYLDYERIKKRLDKTSDRTLIKFIKKNKNSWLAEDLNTELLARYAKQKKWKSIRTSYKKGQGGNKAKCHGLDAIIRTSSGQAKKNALNDAYKVWLSGNRRPKNCNSLFSLLKQNGRITDQAAWQRITLAMEKGKTRLASDLAIHLNEKSLVSLWVKLRKNPTKNLKHKRLKKKDTRSRQLIAYGIKRLARKNPNKARQVWNKFKKSHPFTLKEKAGIESYIGVKQAIDHSPSALQNLSKIPNKYRSDDGNTWMARMALRQGDWRKLGTAITSMNTEEQQSDIWQYWRAQSDKRTGKKTNINLHKLAKNASFYGFLAADQLKKPYERLLQKETNWNQLIPKIRNMHSIRRATELYAIGNPKLAKKEWFWTLKRLNKQDKLAAAAYALQIKQPFLAIITVSQTKDWNQTGLRFPLEYKDLVKRAAKQQGIVPAWAYGIMRRESAFDSQIVSSANAKGLMQVLPSTAKGVARKIGIKNHKTSDLLIPEKNARIGTAYLSQMLKRFKGSYVKATASYNAGPHRIPRWLPDKNISAPQWIESIPFNETRKYVRAVMSYTTIYDHKLNYKARRNLRLS